MRADLRMRQWCGLCPIVMLICYANHDKLMESADCDILDLPQLCQLIKNDPLNRFQPNFYSKYIWMLTVAL